MRPRIFTLRNFALFTLACAIFGGMAYWLSQGAPLPGSSVPSTSGKIVFVSTREGHSHLYLTDPAKPESEVALTGGDTDDEQPTWKRDGSEIAFVSSNKGGSPQVFVMDATPKAKVRTLTNTSPTKSDPLFAGNDQRVYYLDSGKLSSTDPKDNDTDAVLPSADYRSKIIGLLSSGGFEKAVPSPDGKKIVAVLHQERGSVLLVYDTEKQTLQILGTGEKILFSYLPDSSFVAIFGRGTPFTEPQFLLDENNAHNPAADPLTPLPPFPETGGTFLTRFDVDGKPIGALPLPFEPNGIVAVPDSQRIILTSDGIGKATPGVLLLNFSKEQSGGKQIFGKAASEPALSPDGTQIAFVSGNNIYVIPIEGGKAINITNDKGASRTPVWSPAKKEK